MGKFEGLEIVSEEKTERTCENCQHLIDLQIVLRKEGMTAMTSRSMEICIPCKRSKGAAIAKMLGMEGSLKDNWAPRIGRNGDEV